jgi:hypothetical protein
MDYFTAKSVALCAIGIAFMVWAYTNGRIGFRGFPEATSEPMPVPFRIIAFVCGALMLARSAWHLLSEAFVARR